MKMQIKKNELSVIFLLTRTPNKPSTPSNRSNKLNIKNDERPKTPKPRYREETSFFFSYAKINICSFEEEQQELQKSLSKDWCDKMDNEEAEEKKLHSFVLYLKQFSVHENKTTEELLASIECCPKGFILYQFEIFKCLFFFCYRTSTTTKRNK
jgi:hypothetical protein